MEAVTVCVVNGRGAVHHDPLQESFSSAQSVRDSHGERSVFVISEVLHLAAMKPFAARAVRPADPRRRELPEHSQRSGPRHCTPRRRSR